jgi:hypothetical protein
MNALGTSRSAAVVLSLFAVACGGLVDDPAPDAPPGPAGRPVPEVEGTASPNKGPERVAEDVGAPTALALDGDFVVFTTRTTVLNGEKVAAGGLFVGDKRTGPAVLVAIDRRGASYDALATDGKAAFVATSDGRIVTTGLAGGAEKPVATLEAPASLIATAGEHVYYANESGAVGRVAKGGGEPEALARIDADVRAIAAADDALYVATAPKKDAEGAPSLVRIDLATLEQKAIAAPAGQPCAMVRDGQKLFWTTAKANEGAVQRVSVDGQGLTTVASGTFAACAIAADADSLFFATTLPSALPVRSSGGPATGLGLMRAPIAGGTPTPIAEATHALSQPGAVAVDAKHVYWLTETAVLRLAKGVR